MVAEISAQSAYEVVQSVITSRRTNLNIDADQILSEEIVRQVVESIQWAPNHYRTWPWRVAVCLAGGRVRLGETIADSLLSTGELPEKVSKARTKFLRAPVVVVVGSVPGEDALVTGENRDSVAAGIQNMLLSATSLGLASFWSTCPMVSQHAVAMLCDFPVGTHISGIIYIGWAKRNLEPPDRPVMSVASLS